MKHLLSILFLLISLCAYNQTINVDVTVNPGAKADGLGKAVIFSYPDSVLVKGDYMDSSYFSMAIKANLNDTFFIKLTVPEYLDSTIIFVITGKYIQLGTIQMQKDLTLDAVNVVYSKPLFERTMDGIRVNVNGTNLAQMNTLFDVLKASPRLTSPDGESIEIIGKGSPLILVDRQPIISNDELKAIPADRVDRIEIITNPSAKYRAQGSGGGVIEVYTKDFSLEGFQASIRSGFGLSTQNKPAANLNVGFSYKKKKFSINSYLGTQFETNNSIGEGSSTFLDNSNRTYVNSFGGDNSSNWMYYNVKSAYRIKENKRITLGLNGNGYLSSYNSFSNTDYFINDTLTTLKRRNADSKNKWLNNRAFINYTWEPDTLGSSFEVNINYLRKVSDNEMTSLSEITDQLTGISNRFDVKSASNDRPNIGEGRINYTHYFDTTGWILSGGGEYSLLLNSKRFEQANLLEDEWIIDDQYSNSYDYREDMGAAFVELTKKWKKIGFRGGLRSEYTKLDGYSKSLQKQFMDSSYIAIFPSIGMLWEPNDKLGITLYYDKGIERPQFSNYDPFVQYTDSLNIEYGNPYLRPSMQHSIGLEVDLFYSYNISVTYNRADNPVNYLNFVQAGGFLSESTPRNAAYDESIDLSLSIPINLSWLEGWNNLWISNKKYVFTEEFQRELFLTTTFGFYSYITFKLPKRIDIMNMLNLYKWGNDRMISGVNQNWGIRVSKKFEKTKFQFFGEVNNIIPNKQKNTTTNSNYISYSKSQNAFTTFKIGFSHQFGRLKSPDTIKESSAGQSDRL